MKRCFAMLLLVFILFGTSSCGILKQDTQEVKVIPKPDNGENVSKNPAGTTGKQEATKPLDGSLDDKQQSLKTSTENYIRDTIKARADEALKLIKLQDMAKLSQLVHPDKGVRFSPYGHVDTKTDLVFSAGQIKNIVSDKKVYNWGSFDGSGQPIELTFDEYYRKFIYDKDFANAKDIGYNKILGKGNTANNSFEVYPNSIIVEYHFPGFDQKYQGMDWRSLRLVFEKKGADWYIVGIIHDQWTI